jgi:hypothetical protein
VRALFESLAISLCRRNGGHATAVSPTWRVTAVLAMAATIFGAPVRPAAAADEVPPEQQVLILSRALVYDDNFKDRVGSEVRIAVLTKPGHTASEASGAAMVKAWKGVGNLKLAGLPLKVSAMVWKDAATFGPGLAGDAVDVLYVCPGLEANLAEIVELTRKRHVITVGSREDYIRKGVSLGVILVNARPTIMVNLPASKTEGAAFSSDLLRLATVIK